MKTLKKFEFQSFTPRQAAIDFPVTLLDGRIYQLSEREDYSAELGQKKVYGLLRKFAKRHGVSCQVNKVDGGIVFQATEPATDETRAAAKQLRSQKKAEKKARKAAQAGDEVQEEAA